MTPENSELTGRRARRRRARGADAGGGRDGRKWVEHDSFYLITEVCRVWWHDAASTFFRTRPPERFSETNTTSKNVSRAHCRVRGTFGRKLNPFSRELRRVIRIRRETPGASPRARQSERTRPARVPTDSSVGDFGDIHRFRDDGARSTSRDEPRGHARGRRERAALDHAPMKAREEAIALSWHVRAAARAGKSSSYIELLRAFCFRHWQLVFMGIHS